MAAHAAHCQNLMRAMLAARPTCRALGPLQLRSVSRLSIVSHPGRAAHEAQGQSSASLSRLQRNEQL